MNPVTVSVIVPAYNASATIGKTLQALCSQNCFQPYEVIVVDDGSVDDTARVVSGFPSVRYVRQDNAGPASARNHGARVARGEFLAFTDSDCVPHEDWISQLMAGFGHALDSRFRGNGIGGDNGDDSGGKAGMTYGHAQVGAVAGSYGIANGENRLSRCVHREILWRHGRLGDFVNVFGSYNFCVRKNIFEAVGGFNTGYRFASGEDNDLSYKIRQSGWKIYFERRALVDHYHPTRVGKYLKEQFRHGFWRAKMYKDHPAMMGGDGYTFWKDILEIPWAWAAVAGLALALRHSGLWLYEAAVVFLFLSMEIISALVMTRCPGDGIFLGLVLFLRAFGRAFGFSTGILPFLFKNPTKIS